MNATVLGMLRRRSSLSSNLGGSRGLRLLLLGSTLGGTGGRGGLLAFGGMLLVVVLLAGGVDGNLDGDLTALNLLAVHLSASLLLQFLGAESNKTEATALAGLATSLELLNHETGDGAEGDLGRGRGVVLEDLKELLHMLAYH